VDIRIGPAPVVLVSRAQAGAAPVETLDPGAIVPETRRRSLADGRWIHVRLPSGHGGWIGPTAAVEELPTVVVVGDAVLREAPSASAPVVRALRRGARIRVLGARGEGRSRWVQVDLSSGMTGWIHGSVGLEPVARDAVSTRDGAASLVDGAVGQAVSLLLVLGGGLALVLVVSRGRSPVWGAVALAVGIAGLLRPLLRRRAGAAAARRGPPR
jgi:hypothetical protein